MRLKLFLFSCLLFAGLSKASAHAIWIETDPVAKKAASHQVKVFFGEYGDNERDTVAKWFSDLKEIKLWLVSPDGTKTQLSTSDGVNHLSASFTPKEDGVYTLLIAHVVKDMHGKSKIEYNASATVLVGKQAAANKASFNPNEISVFTETPWMAKLQSPIKLQSFYQNKPAAKQKVQVVSPSGWEKVLYSAEDGTTTVTPVFTGVHMVELMQQVKEPGEHNGKPFESTWKIATYCINVK